MRVRPPARALASLIVSAVAARAFLQDVPFAAATRTVSGGAEATTTTMDR